MSSFGFGVAGGVSTLFGFSLLIWLFKETFSRWLLNLSKSEIQRLKHNFNQVTEKLKVDLQKEYLKVEMHHTSKYTNYFELHKKICEADGFIGTLYGIRYAQAWDGFEEKDFRTYLESKKIPTGTIEEIVQSIAEDRIDGLKKLNLIIRNLEFGDASKTLNELKNYILLNEIFLPKNIRENAWEIFKALSAADIDGNMMRMDPRNSKWYESRGENLNKAGAKMNALVDQMRLELCG